MPVPSLAERAVDLIDCEIDLIRMELEYPELSAAASVPASVRWGGNVADLIEYHIGPQTAGLLQHPSGMPMTYEEAVEFIERTYGVTVTNPSDRRAKILERVDNTAFTDKMQKVLLLEAEKQIVKSPRRQIDKLQKRDNILYDIILSRFLYLPTFAPVNERRVLPS